MSHRFYLYFSRVSGKLDHYQIIDTLVTKQARNEARKWPDWRTAPQDKAIEHMEVETLAATPDGARGERPEGDDDRSFDDWTPLFTVWLVREGDSWPMLVDTVFDNEADATARAEMRGGNWHVMKYSHLKPPAADPPPVTETPRQDDLPSEPPV